MYQGGVLSFTDSLVLPSSFEAPAPRCFFLSPLQLRRPPSPPSTPTSLCPAFPAPSAPRPCCSWSQCCSSRAPPTPRGLTLSSRCPSGAPHGSCSRCRNSPRGTEVVTAASPAKNSLSGGWRWNQRFHLNQAGGCREAAGCHGGSLSPAPSATCLVHAGRLLLTGCPEIQCSSPLLWPSPREA